MRISTKACGLFLITALCIAPVIGQGKEEKEKWDVSNPPGQWTTVPINTERGTWLSLDLSPDGTTIVFDLLGDLYLLDLEGGRAESLTSGIEWDMQPTFSPEGKRIAFTSDRGGGDNIWILDLADGEKSAKALTDESFRLLNQPAWDPSGNLIVARKHFTGTRSLGAGELWAYHVKGGDGVRLTKRKNDQLDLGEPAFSPDGRYVYYSLDATGGDRFQYNKDPNKGIYAIERLDRQTGEVERLISGFGGAVAPTPSPDGKKLAFVSRDRGESVLTVLDLEDGTRRALFDGLDRDMQETWAIHGVYPRFTWTPDSRELVFWAQGGFHRIRDGKGASPVAIPFQVDSERSVSKAVRFPVSVSPDRFSVKAVRGIAVSPSGSAKVFAALGSLWLQKGGGEPARLTNLQGTEGDARFVGESKVLHTHWSDAELGSIRLQTVGGESEILVRNWRFAEPALSPDRRYLVYKRLGKTALFDSRYTARPGLYLKDLRSGQERRISESGDFPHFAGDSDHIYFTKGDNPAHFVRHSLTTGEQKNLFKGKTVTQFLLSPDGKTLAFRDGFHLFVTPFVPTGTEQSLSGKAKNLPVEEVSTEVGSYFPSWSGGNELVWNVGPDWWRYAPALGTKTEQKLGWQHPAAKPPGSSVVALVGGKVVTMRGDEVIENGVVLVEGDRITGVGSADEISVPAGAYQVDCNGKTVLPGLIDVHWHGSFSSGGVFPEVNYTGLSSLSFGVTTLHDPSNDTASVFTAKEMQQVGKLLAPRIFSTGTILYGAKAPGYYAHVSSLKEALGHLKRLKSWGAVSVKSYNQPRREQRQQILEAARRTEMMVVPEGGSLFQHNMTMVVDGHTGIEHALPVARIYDDVVDLWSQTTVGYTPTLGVAYGGLWGENFWYVRTDVWDDERLNRFVPREVIDPDARRRVQAPDEEYNHFNAARGAAELAERGVVVNLGAHGQREGLAAHWELWMLEQGGMSPHEALRCGTLNGASYLGMDRDLGSLEAGKLADIIVVDGDPLQNIRDSKLVEYTVQGGVVYRSESMRQLAPKPGDEPTLWWRK